MKIFVSYRHPDLKSQAEIIRKYLLNDMDLRPECISLSITESKESLEGEIDEHTRSQLDSVTHVLLLIDSQWAHAIQKKTNGQFDHVQSEAHHALNNPSIMTIPVLIDNTPMPLASELPSSIQDLCKLDVAHFSLKDAHPDGNRIVEMIMGGTPPNIKGIRESPALKEDRRDIKASPLLIAAIAAVLSLAVFSYMQIKSNQVEVSTPNMSNVSTPNISNVSTPSMSSNVKGWHCLCYQEIINDSVHDSTACRKTSEACEKLKDAINKGSKVLVKDSAKSCEVVPDVEYPWEGLNIDASEWQPSKRPGAWWSSTGCHNSAP